MQEITVSTSDILEGDLKEIYDLVKTKVTQIVSTGKLTSEHIRPLLLNIIEVVQNFTNKKYSHIDGSEKKAMALNILRHVFKDLHQKGQLNDEQYEMIMLSLEFFGGVLIDFGKVVYNKLVDVASDVSEHGCKGCFSRNCVKK